MHYYSNHKANLFIETAVRQQLDLLHLLEMTREQLLSSIPEMLANVFNFTDMDYSIGIISYRKVLEKMGVYKEFDELYDDYDKIYVASQKDKGIKENKVR